MKGGSFRGPAMVMGFAGSDLGAVRNSPSSAL